MSQQLVLQPSANKVVFESDKSGVKVAENNTKPAESHAFADELESQVELHQQQPEKKNPVEKNTDAVAEEAKSESVETKPTDTEQVDTEQNGNNLPLQQQNDAIIDTEVKSVTSSIEPSQSNQSSKEVVDDSEAVPSMAINETKTKESVAELDVEKAQNNSVKNVVPVANKSTQSDNIKPLHTVLKSSQVANNSNSANIEQNAPDNIELENSPKTQSSLRSDIFHALSQQQAAQKGNNLQLHASMDTGSRTEMASVSANSLTSSSMNTHASNSLSSANNVTAAQPVLAVQPTIQNSSWNKVMSSRLVWMAREGVQQAELKLNPASLGQVEVKLTVNNEQASVMFVAQQNATRDALEQALPRLKESLEQQGLQLADADVSQQDFEQQQQTDGEGNNANAGFAHRQSNTDEVEATNATAIQSTTSQELDVGLSLYA